MDGVEQGRPLVEVANLSKNYGSVLALKAASFNIRQGEIIALLGPNGAGKTTMMKILTGFLEPSSGQVKIDGLDIETHRTEVQKRLGYLPENAPIYGEMLVQDYLLFAARMRGVAEGDLLSCVSEAVVNTGLQEVLVRPISELSKGFRQRVGLAQAILHRPKLLILDEPTNGLDPTQIVEMRGLIQRLSKTSTILLSTHILSEAEATCERAIIIFRGEIRADAAMGDLARHQEVRATLLRDGSSGMDQQSIERALGETADFSLVKMTEEQKDGHQFLTLQLRGGGKPVSDRLLALQVAQWCHAKGWKMCELKPHAHNLESIFNDLTRV